jgi:hypothetical protein
MLQSRTLRGISVCLLVGAAWLGAARSAQKSTSPAKQKRSTPANSSISFVDVTRQSGLDFHLTCGSAEKRYIMESMCGGIAVFDYDNDGWMDI